jgi:uncharacterized protein
MCKYLYCNKIISNSYFWRNYHQKEVDYLEELNGELHAYEFKFKKDKYKLPIEFMAKYKPVSNEMINRNNYLDFLL